MNEAQLMWHDKHQPKQLDDFCSLAKLTSRLVRLQLNLQEDREPHIDGLVKQFTRVLTAEGINGVHEEEIRALILRCYPDIRAALNEMQHRYYSTRCLSVSP